MVADKEAWGKHGHAKTWHVPFGSPLARIRKQPCLSRLFLLVCSRVWHGVFFTRLILITAVELLPTGGTQYARPWLEYFVAHCVLETQPFHESDYCVTPSQFTFGHNIGT